MTTKANSNLIDAYETSGTSPTGPASEPNGQPSNDSKTNHYPHPTVGADAEQAVGTPQGGTKDTKNDKEKLALWRADMARKFVDYLQGCNGRFLFIDGELYCVLPLSGGGSYKFRLQKGNLKVDQILLEIAHVTHSQLDGKVIIDRVRVLAAEKAGQVQCGNFALYVPPVESCSSTGKLLVPDFNQILSISARGVGAVENTADFYLEAPGERWVYKDLRPDRRIEIAEVFRKYLADAQSREHRGKLALALAVSSFPFIRQRLDVRPIFQFTGDQGSGKSFTADRFAFLLYGKSALISITEAALKRTRDPLILLDDVERMEAWMTDQLRRASTGNSSKTVRPNDGAFEVEDSGARDAIHVLTAIRIPTDSPLLSRTWLFTFDKEYFDRSFHNELMIRTTITKFRDELLSLLMRVLAIAFRLEEKEGLPDLSVFGRLPAPRTMMAQAYLFLLLRAFDEAAPGLINPEDEFRGFIESQLHEERTLRGQTTDELTLLSNLFDELEREPIIPQQNCRYEDGHLIVTAAKLAELIRLRAKSQGLRLRHSMSAVNVGRWVSSEVRNSLEFTAEVVSVGAGSAKRKMWRIGRTGNSQESVMPGQVPESGASREGG
jgi:hypothetical protein